MPAPTTAKIVWGAAFANTWTFFGAPDNPMPVLDAVGAMHQADSRVVDFWSIRDDSLLKIDVVAIPKLVTGGVTGYSDATTGVALALLWLQKGNIGRYYPDKDAGSYYTFTLIGFDPKEHIQRERGGARYRVHLPMSITDGAQVTNY